MTPKQVVTAYWQAMIENNFYKAAEFLSEDCEIYWPQSNELIKGRKHFILINQEYPAHGEWQFTINNMLVDGQNLVTDVSVSDGVLNAKAITFHTVKGQLIHRQKEYWPDDYEAPKWRKKWVEIVN